MLEQIYHEHELDHSDDYTNGEIILILDEVNLQIEIYIQQQVLLKYDLPQMIVHILILHLYHDLVIGCHQ